MDIATVVQILNDHLKDGVLTLPAGALQSGAIGGVFNAYLPGGQLVLTGVTGITVRNRDSEAVATGTGGAGPFQGAAATAVFTVTSGVAQIDLTASPAAGWKWSDSFPSLANTVLPSLAFAGDAAFEFTSNVSPVKAAPDAPPAVEHGLTFSGTVQVDGPLAIVAWLLGNPASLKLAGPVDIDQGIALPELTATVQAGVDLTLFKFPYVRLVVGAAFVPATATDAARAQGFSRLETEIDFTARGTQVAFPLSAEFSEGGQVVFGVDLTSLNREIDTLLGDLASLLGGVDFSSHLEDVPLSSLLALKGLLVQVSLETQKVNSVRVIVGSTQPWTVLGEQRTRHASVNALVTVNSIDIVLGLFDPFGAKQVGVAIFGAVTIGADGRLVASATLPDFAFALELAPGAGIDLTQIVEHFIGANPDLPALEVVAFDLELDRAAQTFQADIAIDSNWTIPLGSTQLVLEQLAAGLEREGGRTTGHLAGEIEIAGANVAANWDIPGALQIAGSLPTIDLGKLVAALSPEALRHDFPSIVLTNTQLIIERRADGGYYLAAGTTVQNFGAFEVEFLDVGGKTGWAIGFVLVPDWSLQNLSEAFAPLSFVKLAQAGLLYATIDDPNFAFRSFDEPAFKFPTQLPSAPAGAQKGLSLYAQLAIKGGPLDVVAKVLRGLDSLLLAASIPDSYANTQFKAAYSQPLALIKDVLVLDDIYVAFAPGQEEFTLHLDATFTVHGESLKLGGDIVVRAGVVQLELRTETPWANPFGIRGLTLESMAIAIAVGDELTLTLAGEVAIGQGADQVTLEAAAEFNTAEEGAPSAFLAREAGTITLAEIVHTFTQTRLPDVLNTIGLSNFQLIVVADPNGWTDPIDNKHYQPGLAFGGDLLFFHLDARFALQVDYARGVFASGQIDKPIAIHVLTLANATDPKTGPFVQLDTANSPYLSMSVAVTFFEIASLVVQAQIDNGGFLFVFKETIGGLGEADFSIALKDKTSFALAAKANFAIHNLGPIRAGKFNLGTLEIDLALAAHFAIAADTSGNFALSIGAQFTFEGLQLRLDDLTIHDQLTQFSQLPKIFFDNLAALLWDIARSLLQDADALFQLIGRGIIAIGDDIAHILHEELHVAIEKAAALLRSVSAAIGYDARKVAALLRAGFGALDHDVARAMRSAGYAVEDVADAIAHAFSLGAEDVAKALRAAGYDLDAVAAALRHVFGYAAHDVASFFKNVFHAVDKDVHAALAAAGFVASEIASAMKAVFNWVEHVVDKIKDKLNPKHW